MTGYKEIDNELEKQEQKEKSSGIDTTNLNAQARYGLRSNARSDEAARMVYNLKSGNSANCVVQ